MNEQNNEQNIEQMVNPILVVMKDRRLYIGTFVSNGVPESPCSGYIGFDTERYIAQGDVLSGLVAMVVPIPLAPVAVVDSSSWQDKHIELTVDFETRRNNLVTVHRGILSAAAERAKQAGIPHYGITTAVYREGDDPIDLAETKEMTLGKYLKMNYMNEGYSSLKNLVKPLDSPTEPPKNWKPARNVIMATVLLYVVGERGN